MTAGAARPDGGSPGGGRMVRRIGGSGAAHAALVCFPHAGGAPAVFRPWAARLADRFEVWAARGRDRALTGPPAEQWPVLARRFADDIADVTGPLVLYGHSMGALHAYETARELRERGRAVRRLVVSGRRAPHLPPLTAVTYPDDPALLLRAVAERFGGVPADVLAEPEAARYYGAEMAADFALVDAYAWREGPPLDVPLVALAGAGDAAVDDDGLRAWSAHTAAEFAAVRVPGGHFFTAAQLDAVFARLDPEQG